MKKVLLTLTFITITFLIAAQVPSFSWAKEIDTKNVLSDNPIAKDTSNNIYVATDKGVIKYNNAGTIIWQKTIAGSTCKTFGISLDASGNVYTTGTFSGSEDFDPSAATSTLTSLGGLDVYILKLDGSGNFIWAKSFGGSGDDKVYDMAVDAAGNVHTTGTYVYTVDFDPNVGVLNYTSSGSSSIDMFISKVNTSGNLVWAKSIGSQYGNEEVRAISLDAAGDVFTNGFFSTFIYPVDFDPSAGTYTFMPIGINDVFVSKLDASGNFVWAKQIATTINSSRIDGLAMVADASGNIFCTGKFNGNIDFDPGPSTFTITSTSSNSFIFKLNFSGGFAWAKSFETIGSTGSSYGKAINIDATGNVYTTGAYADGVDFNPSASVYSITPQSAYWTDSYVHKLDASGNFMWAVGMGGTSEDYGSNVTIDSDNNIYTTGYFQMAVNDFDPGPLAYALTPSLGSGYIQKLGTGPVGIKENNKSNVNFNVYPNPTNGILNIKLLAEALEATFVEITDVLGKVQLLETITETNTQLNVSDMAKGIYFVTLSSNKKTSTRKLIIN